MNVCLSDPSDASAAASPFVAPCFAASVPPPLFPASTWSERERVSG